MIPHGEHMSLARFRRPVVELHADASLAAAARAMRDHRVGCVVITRESRPIAVLTDRDIVLRAVAEELDCASTPVCRCVTYDPVTVSEQDDAATAAARMRASGIRRLPVVDEGGRVVGIVTADDLLGEVGRELADLCAGIEDGSDAFDSR